MDYAQSVGKQGGPPSRMRTVGPFGSTRDPPRVFIGLHRRLCHSESDWLLSRAIPHPPSAHIMSGSGENVPGNAARPRDNLETLDDISGSTRLPTSSQNDPATASQLHDPLKMSGAGEDLQELRLERVERQDSHPDRTRDITDAMRYLDDVKTRFQDRPDVYYGFMDILRDFKRNL